MKILVMGRGVIGVTTAWYLCQAGHEVTVIERESGPALGIRAGNQCGSETLTADGEAVCDIGDVTS